MPYPQPLVISLEVCIFQPILLSTSPLVVNFLLRHICKKFEGYVGLRDLNSFVR
ncbi:hypothetical protein K443DRAFT_193683 [Laccaria amethystina LaAM-08-1]|uniref:Uncharacterized protein n=1 Tax=Laccaria amethystina LaAM-08-1 TaxID=1095629 RepID=A0A0C9XMS0_9AGAR|nr:hypothetical protein K443DRAFT_193683 [Laccaria amethystina LaAM-08-1]